MGNFKGLTNGLTIFDLTHKIFTSTTQELNMTKQFTKFPSLENTYRQKEIDKI